MPSALDDLHIDNYVSPDGKYRIVPAIDGSGDKHWYPIDKPDNAILRDLSGNYGFGELKHQPSRPATPTPRVSDPSSEGGIFNFPYGIGTAARVVRAMTPDLGTPGRLATGWNDTMSEGWGDELTGQVYSHLPTWAGGDSYANIVNAQRKKLAESGIAGTVGQVVGAAMQPLNYINPLLSGTLYGAGAADPDPHADDLTAATQRTLGAGIGMATSAAAPFAVKTGMNLANKYLPAALKPALSAAEQRTLQKKQGQIDLVDYNASQNPQGIPDPAALRTEAAKVVNQIDSGAQTYWTPSEQTHWRNIASGKAPLSTQARSLLLDPERSAWGEAIPDTLLGAAHAIPMAVFHDTMMNNPGLWYTLQGLVGAPLTKAARTGMQNAGRSATQAIENAPLNTFRTLQRSVTGTEPLPLNTIPGIIQLLKTQAVPVASGQFATSQAIPYSHLPYGAQ